jgi:4-hydroxybenzoate polyprenyltransferase
VFSFRTLLGFLTVFLIFFHLRLFDDLKDYDKDRSRFPDRLLSKELITVNQIKYVSVLIIGLETIFSSILGLQAILFYLIVLFYSILMYFEFFIKDRLKKNVLVYNFSHQILIVLMGIYIYVVYHSAIQTINVIYLCFLLNMFLIFALFEFTRKIKHEKDPHFDLSYIYNFGRRKFSILITSLLFIVTALSIFTITSVTTNPIFYLLQILVALCTFVLSILYVKESSRVSYKTIKISYSVFMLLILLIFIISILISKQFTIDLSMGWW